MKKLLSVLLALAMLATMLAIPAMATEGETPADNDFAAKIPDRAPGVTVHTIVIMKPATEGPGAGYSSTRFIFTPNALVYGNPISTYSAQWGIGYYRSDESMVMPTGDNHAAHTQFNYQTSETYFWDVDSDGCGYFQNIIVPEPNGTEANEGKWVDSMGNVYDTLYEMAAAGQLLGYIGEHTDGGVGGGVQDGLLTCDGSITLRGNYNNPNKPELDAIVLRVVTEEEYYNEDGSVKNPQSGEYVSLDKVVAHAPFTYPEITTLTGKETSKLSFVFIDWEGDSYDCVWKVGLKSTDEDGNEVYTWFDCDNDEDIKVNGEQKATSWDSDLFKWQKDEYDAQTFQVIFQIPESVLTEHGYETMYEAAKDGTLYAYIGDTDDDDPADGMVGADFHANTTIDDKDACLLQVVYGEAYYSEFPPEVDLPEDTDEEDDETDAKDTGATEETGAKDTTGNTGDKTEGGCGSAIGVAALVLAAALAMPAVIIRKKD